jgi:dihydroorotate dehydrogenase (NAD+) catalytic subunit
VLGNALPAALPDGRPAGLSGPATGPVALRCVAEACAALPRVPVVGCGGVATVADVRAHLAVGAVGVQVGSALLHDPTAVVRLLADLPAGTGHATGPDSRTDSPHSQGAP